LIPKAFGTGRDRVVLVLHPTGLFCACIPISSGIFFIRKKENHVYSKPSSSSFFILKYTLRSSRVLAGQTRGRDRVVLDFLFLLHQGKRKSKKTINGLPILKTYIFFAVGPDKIQGGSGCP